MDAFGVLDDVLDGYESFVQGFLNIRDPMVLGKVEREVENGLMWPEPWLALNRQDASLQAGHFNDFVLVGLVRSAVYQAARTAQERDPDEPLTDDDLGRRVVEHLRVEIGDYAQNPHVEYAARAKVTKALRESVADRVWADLRRGWRITMPNLMPPKVPSPAEGAPPTPQRWRCARWPARSAAVAPAPPG